MKMVSEVFADGERYLLAKGIASILGITTGASTSSGAHPLGLTVQQSHELSPSLKQTEPSLFHLDGTRQLTLYRSTWNTSVLQSSFCVPYLI